MPDPIISIPWADDSMTVLDFNKVKVNGELAVDLLAERDKLRDLLSIAKSALEKARPILGFHEYEPWRNEMDKQTGHAASVVRHALDRLNQ